VIVNGLHDVDAWYWVCLSLLLVHLSEMVGSDEGDKSALDIPSGTSARGVLGSLSLKQSI